LRLVLVGARSPLGAEVKPRLEASDLSFAEVVMAEADPVDDEGGRLLSDFDGEALLVQDAREIDYGRFDLAVLLGSPETTAPVLEAACRARGCVDASGASRNRKGTVWAQWGIQPPRAIPRHGLLAAPQPVASTLARLLHPLSRAGLLQEAGATVLLPAAALGLEAVKELHQQAVEVMSFQVPPEEHLKRQLAFNVLPWEDPLRAESASLAEDLAMEVGRLLQREDSPCDLQLLLVPAFHGFGFSLRLSLEKAIPVDEVMDRLQGEGIEVGDGAASTKDALESEHILVSRARLVSPHVCRLWAVADSLGAGAADNVVRLVEHLSSGAPAGSGPGE
jgi:aspartate-semialdehyde dehydrogenase